MGDPAIIEDMRVCGVFNRAPTFPASARRQLGKHADVISHPVRLADILQNICFWQEQECRQPASVT
jgi:hypothetical protein